MNLVQRLRIKKIRAAWRDSLLLLREFAWPLALFAVVVLGGGLLYESVSAQMGEPVDSLAEAVYLVLGLIFLQPTIEFPHDWHLQIFFFLLPVLGITAIAQGVIEFSALFFNRKHRSKEWEMAVASTFNHHIILVGLGHLGFQIVKNLIAMDQDVVIIELNPDAELFSEVQSIGAPVIAGDANKNTTLTQAGIQKADKLVLCTQNDQLNMQIAIKAKALNPNLEIIIRIFDQQFASAIETQFNFTALSSSVISAPQFAGIAAGVEMTRPISMEGESYSLVKFHVSKGSKLQGITAKELEQDYDVSLVVINRKNGKNGTERHPHPDSRIDAGDAIIVLAFPSQIKSLIKVAHA